MKKEEVQLRILQDGKPLSLNKFNWDEDTNTLSTKENYLFLNFEDDNYCNINAGNNCTIKTGHYCSIKAGDYCVINSWGDCYINTTNNCTIKSYSGCTLNVGDNCIIDSCSDCNINTGNNCTIDVCYDCNITTSYGCIVKTYSNCTINTDSHSIIFTSYNCNINTGDNCTINSGDDCTINTKNNCDINTCNCSIIKTSENCVIIRYRTKNLEIIKPKKYKKIQIAPCGVKGYIEDGVYSETGKPTIIFDNILSEYTSKKVLNELEIYKIKEGYVVKDGNLSAHGKTIKQCKEDLKYKISNRDTSKYQDYTLDTIVSQEEAIKMYRIITGACEFGTKEFCKSINLKEEYSIEEIIDITRNQYGDKTFRSFFINKLEK